MTTSPLGAPASRATPPAFDRRALVGIAWTVVAMHVTAGVLLLLVLRQTTTTATISFGGLALTAYFLGARHAFDADHIAAIDNTTRTLIAQRRPSATVGLWFSLGHSTIVFAMAVLVAAGAGIVGTLLADGSGAQATLGIIGASVSGVFLLVIGVLNLLSFLQAARLWRASRSRPVGHDEIEKVQLIGPLTRLLRPVLAAVDRPSRMYLVGLLFGLGFDTATETGLLILAGTSASIGMSWYAILLLPLLFACGMSLFDSADGVLMQRAYGWAFLNPMRKLRYNLAVTAISVTIALGIGVVQVAAVLRELAGLADPVTGWIAGLDLDDVGFYIVGLFIVIWGVALVLWKLTNRRSRTA